MPRSTNCCAILGLLIADRELASFYGTQDGPATAEEMVVGRSMLRSNPPNHTRMRRLAAGAFTPRRLESMRETIVTQATTLTKYLAHLGGAGEPIDFITEFAYPLPIRVICALLGGARRRSALVPRAGGGADLSSDMTSVTVMWRVIGDTPDSWTFDEGPWGRRSRWTSACWRSPRASCPASR
jgi:cytochrome P450